jgi:pescadillo protein
MLTFLEFYETLLSFVNYKLYTSMNLVYPPKVDESKDEDAVGLGAFIIESTEQDEVLDQVASLEANQAGVPTSLNPKEAKKIAKASKNLLKRLDLDNVENDQAENADMDHEMEEDNQPTDFSRVSAVLSELQDTMAESSSPSSLFSTCVFYLSREVPRSSLEFVIRAFGGRLGWDPILGGGSPFNENDPRITHHITDRPIVDQKYNR